MRMAGNPQIPRETAGTGTAVAEIPLGWNLFTRELSEIALEILPTIKIRVRLVGILVTIGHHGDKIPH